MTITNCTIDRGSVYADILLAPEDVAAAGSPQEAVKTALDALAREEGVAALIYTRVTAMDAQPDGSLAVSLEGAIPPEVILGPYLGVEVDIGHCEDYEDAALRAAENYIGMGMQEIGAFAQSFDGVLDADAQEIVRAAERRACARGEMPAEQIAEDVFDAWLRTEGKTRDTWRAEQREYAELLSRIDFLLAAVADEEGVTADDEELERAACELAAQYQMSVDEVLAAVGADAIRHHIRMTKADQLIVENARNK